MQSSQPVPHTVPRARQRSSRSVLTSLPQEAVVRISPISQGESVAREGRVTNLFPQLASGGGEDLNPESLAHKWGKDEGIWMQVMDSAGGLTSPLSLQTSGKTQGPEPASAGVQAEVDAWKRLSGVSEPAPAWGAHGVPHCRVGVGARACWQLVFDGTFTAPSTGSVAFLPVCFSAVTGKGQRWSRPWHVALLVHRTQPNTSGTRETCNIYWERNRQKLY